MNFFYFKVRSCTNTTLFLNPNLPNEPNCVQVCPVKFYGNTTLMECMPCLTQCGTCTSPTSCVTCNSADFRTLSNNLCPCNEGYYPNPNGSSVCVLCSTQHTGCATCTQISGSFSCLSCLSGFAWTGTACISCSINMCLNYTYNGTGCLCSVCQTGTARFGSPLGVSCATCVKSNCLAGAFIGSVCSCTQCAVGYAISGADCVTCATVMPNCLQCTSNTTCTGCDTANYFWLNEAGSCQTCSITGCTTCASISTCAVCDTTNDFFLSGRNSCTKCSLSQCLDCTNLTACQTCNTTNSFHLNTTNNVC